jgi:hypothetical protein
VLQEHDRINPSTNSLQSALKQLNPDMLLLILPKYNAIIHNAQLTPFYASVKEISITLGKRTI